MILMGKMTFFFDFANRISRNSIERIKEVRPKQVIKMVFLKENSKRTWFDTLSISNLRLYGKRIVPATKGNITPVTAIFRGHNNGFRRSIKMESVIGTSISKDNIKKPLNCE
jgi:hypothetical protein